MEDCFLKLVRGYDTFRQKYASGDRSVMKKLADYGQQPQVMVIACSDSRVDPALILQCDPGELFVIRNVASIVPPYEKDKRHHGTSAALEFGIRYLKVKHLVLLGHSQCGGIEALMSGEAQKTDFIGDWVSLSEIDCAQCSTLDQCAQASINRSYQNCLTFPWIKEKVITSELSIHQWYFEIKSGSLFTFSSEKKQFILLELPASMP